MLPQQLDGQQRPSLFNELNYMAYYCGNSHEVILKKLQEKDLRRDILLN